MANLNLIQRINKLGTAADKVGKEGLTTLVEAMENISAFDKNGAPARDWDALAHFCAVFQRREGDFSAIKRIIRAAFGKQLSMAKDPKHPSGWRFNFTEACAGGKKGAPVWDNQGRSVIFAAIDKGHGFNASELQKPLKDMLKEEPVAKVWDEKRVEAAAKRLAKQVENEGLPIDILLAKVKEIMKAEAAMNQNTQAALEAARKSAKVIDIDNVARAA